MFRKGMLLTAVFAAVLSFAGISARAGDVSAEVTRQAKQQEYTRVIVELSTVSALEDGVVPSAQREVDIDATTDAILGGLFQDRAKIEDRGLRKFKLNPIFALSLTASEIKKLAADPRVKSIKLDGEKSTMLDKSIPFINAQNMFLDGVYGYESLIAIIDTGVDIDHPFYKRYIGRQACFSTTDKTQSMKSLCPGGKANDFSSTAADDCPTSLKGCGHGTHVAGIATGANVGATLHGVAPYAGLVPIKVFSRKAKAKCGSGATTDCVTATTSDIIAALEWLYITRGHIKDFPLASINMSLGGGYYTDYCNDDPIRPIIKKLLISGVATVVAAGNEKKIKGVASPACIKEAVTVGAVCNESDDIKGCAAYTNMGPQVDILAPGSDIQSSVVGGGYGNKSGTSMAAPHIAGLFAAFNNNKAAPCLGVGDLLSAMQSTGVAVKDNRTGGTITKRRVDAGKALELVKKNNKNGHTIDVYGQGEIVFTEGTKKGTYTPASYQFLIGSDCPANKGFVFPTVSKFLTLKSIGAGKIEVKLNKTAANKLPKGFSDTSFTIGNKYYTQNSNQGGAYTVDAFVKRRFAP